MSLRSPTEHEDGGFSWRLVIPAQSLARTRSGAGIHPHPNLDTGFRRYDGPRPTTPCSYFCTGIFEEGTKVTKVRTIVIFFNFVPFVFFVVSGKFYLD
jgi:hypothetical protein